MMDRSMLWSRVRLARVWGTRRVGREDERDGESTMPTTNHDGAENELGESPENPGEGSVGLQTGGSESARPSRTPHRTGKLRTLVLPNESPTVP